MKAIKGKNGNQRIMWRDRPTYPSTYKGMWALALTILGGKNKENNTNIYHGTKRGNDNEV